MTLGEFNTIFQMVLVASLGSHRKVVNDLCTHHREVHRTRHAAAPVGPEIRVEVLRQLVFEMGLLFRRAARAPARRRGAARGRRATASATAVLSIDR